ncbi:IPT/TIG domain-containing protein [Actinoplanes sp. NPDC026619]|uniref:IPT/TIG domain-containing protein n=1 Tax=Actinoplanes sp. NPDC026619 TaxID=3155798 RepID=UPI0033C60B36
MRRKARHLSSGFLAVAVAATGAVGLQAVPAAAAAGKTRTVYPTGLVPPKEKVAAKLKIRAQGTLPASVDLRAGAPAVGDQGQVGSCVAWSVGYSLSGYYAKSIANAGAPYAPLYLYMRTVQGTPGPDTGLSVSAALRNEQTEGIDTQADYYQGTTNYSVVPTAGQVANAANYKLTGWTTLFSGTQGGTTAQTAIQQSLADGVPVSISIPVYNAFYSINSMSGYTSTTGAIQGYHQITAYGYDATGLIIRNSWGTRWGSSGDAKLAWSFVNTKVMAAYTVAGVSDKGQASVSKPKISGLSLAKAAAGTTVTITGSNLSTATSVSFGTVSADFTNVTTDSGAAGIAAVVPAGQKIGSTVDVTVTNGAGTSTAGTAGKFTYAAPAPTTTALAPATATTLGGTLVTLTGTNLTGASVKVGTVAVSPKNVTATSLTFTAPARAAGSAGVTVTTAGGTATTALTYVAPDAPAVTSLSATSVSSKASTPITVTGTSFVGAVSAIIDGKKVSATRVSDTQVKITAPAHAAGTVSVVITAGGGSSAPVDLTYVQPAPVVSSLSPAFGSATKGATVTINGANFTGATSARMGDTDLDFTVLSDTKIKVTVPATAAGGYVVTVTTASGTSTATSVKYAARA